MICTSCKATLPDNSNFCRYCGRRVEQGTLAALSREVTSKFRPSRAVSGAVAAAASPQTAIAEMRMLLEDVAKAIEGLAGRFPNEVGGDILQGIKDYLRQHCKVCGVKIARRHEESAGLCKNCHN